MMPIKNLKNKLAVTAVFASAVCLMRIFGVPCLIKALTGITCPGCGMTRAYVSLLHLDFAGAFRYHKMFWAPPILYVYFLFDGKVLKNKTADGTVLILTALGFLVNWTVNLIK